MRVIIEASRAWYCVVVSNLFNVYFPFLLHLRNMKCQTNGTSFVPVAFLIAFVLGLVPYWTGYSHLTNQTPFFNEQ